MGSSCPWNGGDVFGVDTEMQKDGETGWWQSGKGIMMRGMENAPMDRRSMPALSLHFDLSSFSCFQPQVAADRWGSGGSRGTSPFEVEDPHHTMVEGCWPTSLTRGEARQVGNSEGGLWALGILDES